MSFDVRPVYQQPMIMGAQQMKNDGGGGNLGYMQQGKKKKKDEEASETNLIDKQDADSIELSFEENDAPKEEEKEGFSAKKWLDNISTKIAGKFVKKSNNPFSNAL